MIDDTEKDPGTKYSPPPAENAVAACSIYTRWVRSGFWYGFTLYASDRILNVSKLPSSQMHNAFMATLPANLDDKVPGEDLRKRLDYIGDMVEKMRFIEINGLDEQHRLFTLGATTFVTVALAWLLAAVWFAVYENEFLSIALLFAGFGAYAMISKYAIARDKELYKAMNMPLDSSAYIPWLAEDNFGKTLSRLKGSVDPSIKLGF